jgi:hypothetical protein
LEAAAGKFIAAFLCSLDIEIARADLWKCTWRVIKKTQLNRSGFVDQPL